MNNIGNSLTEATKKLLGVYMTQDRHIGPLEALSESNGAALSQNGPIRPNPMTDKSPQTSQAVVHLDHHNAQSGGNSARTGQGEATQSNLGSGPGSGQIALATSFNPSHLPPARPLISIKRKPETHIPIDDDQDDDMEGLRNPFKRQRPGESPEEDHDALMFLPMEQQPYRLLRMDGSGGFVVPLPSGQMGLVSLPSRAEPLGLWRPAIEGPPVDISRPERLAIEGAPATSSATGSGGHPSVPAITHSNRLAIEGAPAGSSLPAITGGRRDLGNSTGGDRNVHTLNPATSGSRNVDVNEQGSSSGGSGRSGNGRRSHAGGGGARGRGGDPEDGSDGDVESEEEGPPREKGKGRARLRQPPASVSQSEITNIRGDLRRLDGTMASVGRAVSTVGNALVQLTDVQAMFINSFVQNGNPLPAQAGNASSARDAHAERFARETELDYRTRKSKAGLKLRGFPQPRSKEQNGFAELIREVTRERMGRKNHKSPFVVEKIPSKEDVTKWEETKTSHACTWDDFRLDLAGTPHSSWNNSVIEVFVDGFIQHGKDLAATEGQIREAFGSHVKTLVSTYRRLAKDADVIKAWKKARKAYERQKNMHARRLAVCYEHKGLEDAAKILMRLGVEGMSSDESEIDDSNFKSYKIRVKKWRNPALADYLRTLDALHRRSRTNPVTGSSQGAEVHRRRISTDSSRRGAVARLPLCAYDPDWLKGLNEYDLEQLRPTDESFKWEHTTQIKDLSRANNKPSDPPGAVYV